MLPNQNPEFDALFDGMLFSLLTWEQLENFWGRLDVGAGWYLYALGETRPELPADGAHVATFLRELDMLLRKEHDEEYCGIVYADNLEQPSLIKIYDPNHLGTSCGSSKQKVLPGWVMSRMPPSDLDPSHHVPQNRRRWWQGIVDLLGGNERT
ncbi:hypothetical protein EZJ19_02895 [Parasulfuritortus cantonensis]|uniref:Uncharacterized protein n=1 Tax=Parasulfuritortus cantonensis TaxID=2528202 RepID=A0A4R1BLJ5_9PROT|nr:hypothetical protein [Parasulfuritortus cantonensis]TCJ18197.1 hypothetical protein EZJ19_02895 [Parasulfuritortus cantonensis]